MSILIQSSTDNSQSPSIPLSAFGKPVTADAFTSLLIDFNNLPGTGSQLVCHFQSLGTVLNVISSRVMVLGTELHSKLEATEQLYDCTTYCYWPPIDHLFSSIISITLFSLAYVVSVSSITVLNYSRSPSQSLSCLNFSVQSRSRTMSLL